MTKLEVFNLEEEKLETLKYYVIMLKFRYGRSDDISIIKLC